MGIRRVVMIMVVAVLMTMAMMVIVRMTMGVVVMMVMPVVVIVPVIVLMSMIMVMPVTMIVTAATIRPMLVMVSLARRWRIHHRLQIGVGRGIHQMGIFATERDGRAVIEHRLQRIWFGMGMQRRKRQAVLATEILITTGGVTIPLARTVFQAAADTLDMVVMAFLGPADISLETQHLFAILAHLAVHHGLPFQGFAHAILKGVQHQGMIVQIARLDELDLGIAGRDFIRVGIDALHQYAGKQEIRENDDALVAEFCGMGQAGLDQGKGHAGIAGLAPAKPHAFPEHAHDLSRVGIGIRIGGAATDHHQERVMAIDHTVLGIGRIDGRLDAITGRPDHLEIDAKLASVVDHEAGMLGLVGVENRGDIVLRVACRKQHARHGQNAGHPLRPQTIQPLGNDGIAEFQVAILDRHIRVAGLQRLRDDSEFARRILIATAMSADHDSKFFRHLGLLLRKNRHVRSAGPAQNGSMAIGTAPELAPCLGRPHRTIFQPVEQAPSHMPRALSSRHIKVKPVCAILAAICANPGGATGRTIIWRGKHLQAFQAAGNSAIAMRRRVAGRASTPSKVGIVPEILLHTLFLLFLAAVFAGFVDSIAGGGGLITIPAMLIAGIPPLETLGTNKLQSQFGSASATIAYARRGHVDLKSQLPMALVAAAGGIVGAGFAAIVPGEVLRAIMPVLLVSIALYFALKPNLSDQDSHRRMTPFLFGVTLVPLIGFYDGVFGPGTGSFFMLAFVSLAGFGMLKATAHTKLLNFGSNAGAFLVFVFTGSVLWKIGLVMGLGQFLGAQVGSRFAMRGGARIIKPLLVISCCAMAVRLLADPSNPLRTWIGL